MGIYTDSVLEKQKQYTVQNVSHMKDYSYLIGNKVLLLDINGSTASILKVNKHYIPVRSLINVVGYTAKSVAIKNADGFAVVSRNTLGIPVGTAYLNPTRITTTHFFVEVDGKEIKVPLDIVCSLVKDKSLQKSPKITTVSNKLGVPAQVVEDVSEFISPIENRKDILEIPASIVKLLPHVNLQDLRDQLKHKEDVYSDYDGNLHKTIAEADKANQKIRHKLNTDVLIKMVSDHLNIESEVIRNK